MVYSQNAPKTKCSKRINMYVLSVFGGVLTIIYLKNLLNLGIMQELIH